MFRMIQLESLMAETLPGVPLFILHGEKYVMYKDAALPFTEYDKNRLLGNNVKFLFVRTGDMVTYNQYVESNLPDMLGDGKLEPLERQKILYQASVNYVHEVFDQPASAMKVSFERCKHLMQNILKDILKENGVMTALGGLVDHSSYTYVHSVHVATYSVAMHMKICKDLEHDELVDVGIGSLFHDYGKVYTPKALLEKPGKLTDAEFEELKLHPVCGYEALKDLGIFSPTSLSIVKHHHEKENGKGYPNGLLGCNIARSSKITAIADVFSALTTNRAYRKALPREEAMEIMFVEMEGSFDMNYLEVLKVLY